MPHQEREVFHLLLALNAETLQQLVDGQVELRGQVGVKRVHIALRLQRDARQVDRRETQVAAGVGNFALRVANISDDAGATPHIGDFRLRSTRFVVL